MLLTKEDCGANDFTYLDLKLKQTKTLKQVLFAKRYLKYLTRKFLKREKLRDYFRPVSNGKHEYQLRYYNIDLGDDAAEE